MASYLLFYVANSDIVAWAAEFMVIGQSVEHRIKYFEVKPPLFTPPGFLGITGNSNQVVLGLLA